MRFIYIALAISGLVNTAALPLPPVLPPSNNPTINTGSYDHPIPHIEIAPHDDPDDGPSKHPAAYIKKPRASRWHIRLPHVVFDRTIPLSEYPSLGERIERDFLRRFQRSVTEIPKYAVVHTGWYPMMGRKYAQFGYYSGRSTKTLIGAWHYIKKSAPQWDVKPQPGLQQNQDSIINSDDPQRPLVPCKKHLRQKNLRRRPT